MNTICGSVAIPVTAVVRVRRLVSVSSEIVLWPAFASHGPWSKGDSAYLCRLPRYGRITAEPGSDNGSGMRARTQNPWWKCSRVPASNSYTKPPRGSSNQLWLYYQAPISHCIGDGFHTSATGDTALTPLHYACCRISTPQTETQWVNFVRRRYVTHQNPVYRSSSSSSYSVKRNNVAS